MQFRDSLATTKILIKYKGLGADRNFPALLPPHSATILDPEFVQPGLTLQTGKYSARWRKERDGKWKSEGVGSRLVLF